MKWTQFFLFKTSEKIKSSETFFDELDNFTNVFGGVWKFFKMFNTLFTKSLAAKHIQTLDLNDFKMEIWVVV